MAEERGGSILAADFGNVTTRVILIDLVDGVYRMVARGEGLTTSSYPIGNASVGLHRVARQLSEVTRRRLLNDKEQIITPEQPDRSGVDYFVATTSTGRTLRTVLIGLIPEVSLASGLRAAAGTYIQIVEELSLNDDRTEEDQLNAILSSRPDLIFITGGTEGGAAEPVLAQARVVQFALRLLGRGRKPAVLYAGNSALVPAIRALFDGLTTVLVAPNVRPTIDAEELEAAQVQLALAFDQRQTGQSGGFAALGKLSEFGVLPTAQSYYLITEYLGQTLKGNVLAVDIGSAVGTLSASVDGRVTTAIRTDIGLGHSADSLLNLVGETAIKRWVPFITTPNQIRHYTLNKTLRPGTIPETLKGLYLEHALLRAGIQTLLAASRPSWTASAENTITGNMPPFEVIIGAGAALTRTGHPGFNALRLLDANQPTGVTQLQADPYGLIAALGGLAHVNPGAVVQVMDGHSLERLGTAISLSGQPTVDRTAMRVKITTETGEVIKQDIAGGHLWVYPLGLGKTARVDVSASGRGTSIGGRGRIRLTLEGGSAGLIFDARGRSLPLAADARGRAAQMPTWIAEVTGAAVIPIDEEWLVDALEEGNLDNSQPKPPPEMRGRRGRRSEAKPTQETRQRRGFGRRGKQAADAGDDILTPDDMPDDDFQNELDELRGR